MSDLVEFLLARIDEDEAQAQSLLGADYRRKFRHAGSHAETWCNSDYDEEGISLSPERFLAECESKRRIVELHEPGGLFVWGDGPACAMCGDVVTVPWPCDTLKLLALPYADHPDYRAEWRP